MVLSRILACLVAFFYTAADAEITPWKIGGSGLDWAESDSLAILVDKASGAIQPVYIRPTRPVFSYPDVAIYDGTGPVEEAGSFKREARP